MNCCLSIRAQIHFSEQAHTNVSQILLNVTIFKLREQSKTLCLHLARESVLA